MNRRFSDRTEAGQMLAERLETYSSRDGVVVHGLPRGGVPVAFEVARALRAPLDVMVVRKVGVPGHEELAMGAVASGGVFIRNDSVIAGLGIDEDAIEETAEVRRREVREREERLRGDRRSPSVEGSTAIVVDDGIATGSTMRAAIRGLRWLDPERIVIAVPVAPPDICHEMKSITDEVVCLMTPDPFMAVGNWYDEFTQTKDADVRRLLDRAAEWQHAA